MAFMRYAEVTKTFNVNSAEDASPQSDANPGPGVRSLTLV